MKDVMGIINIVEAEGLLKGITHFRPVASVPFGGRYRVIDFVLSSMVNSGMHNVGVFTRNKYRSVMNHLRSGKEWDLDRKRDGLFLFPPEDINATINSLKGDLQNIYINLNYIHRSSQKHVLITGGNIVCNIDYRKAFQHHLDTKADITVICKEPDENILDYSQYSVLETREDGRVIDMKVSPDKSSRAKISLDMFIMEKSFLLEVMDACISRGYYDLVRDGFIRNIGMLNMQSYEYQGYWAKIYSINSYYKYSMDLLRPEIMRQLFFKPGLIYTKVKDEAPVKYLSNANVINSIVANGCVIDGTVENSILFRGVKIHKGAYVKDSILMQKTEIRENAFIENIITDKMVTVTCGTRLNGVKNYPIVIDLETVV
ncbi:glucose-1-phosphate adenylyltransferase, GlgD subunit [Desulfofarcimen acetoxidans DSM 771]|jgi:glucose-1-phosphate adenylyltransferase|uniref:Glucose-1-phosphate adenylyltransferase, GlgD subunit n=1 Tax=Desulfofarcimen acetoxidans (strain ATCC 49208 / DSM 771 / KCTC 5769 / VKM B-1644 / 5575) TaxID=485916 RepID=C8W264_DESAS|nr:glucose-1-phosphate adenylyltransferase subunit GlgD [Desulfofarcimen acetoxidans]ACV61728.1 glucose-1-phosphate adenylyltransferase, GlgD subunit [Desulfofarcimen acetoxidans DSM 771]